MTREEEIQKYADELAQHSNISQMKVIFGQGAKFGHDKGVTVGVTAIMDKLITAYNNGKLSVDEMKKILYLLKK